MQGMDVFDFTYLSIAGMHGSCAAYKQIHITTYEGSLEVV